jgi:hypothetical protein
MRAGFINPPLPFGEAAQGGTRRHTPSGQPQGVSTNNTLQISHLRRNPALLDALTTKHTN